jgi:hypothetical protein
MPAGMTSYPAWLRFLPVVAFVAALATTASVDSRDTTPRAPVPAAQVIAPAPEPAAAPARIVLGAVPDLPDPLVPQPASPASPAAAPPPAPAPTPVATATPTAQPSPPPSDPAPAAPLAPEPDLEPVPTPAPTFDDSGSGPEFDDAGESP